MILECPNCYSHRAEVLDSHPLRARCFDCTTIYPVQTVKANAGHHCGKAKEQEPTRKRAKTKADYRAEITPAPPLSPEELGPNTLFMQEVIRATPEQVAKAEHIAQKYSAKFGQEFEAPWFLQTEWLTKLKSVNRVRARAALRWRPKFLAALAIGRTMVFACKTASVAYNTAKYHRAQDRQFDEQCLAAMDYAGELLESRAFQRALEGDVEPIMYMGVVVGHIRKFDSKLQIEMLRAYKPDRFKTPGVNVNVGVKGDIFVLTEEARKELQEINKGLIASYPTDQKEWDAMIEAESHDPRRQRALSHNANDLDECSEEFRCIQCFKLLPRTHLARDAKRCQQCAGGPGTQPGALTNREANDAGGNEKA